MPVDSLQQELRYEQQLAEKRAADKAVQELRIAQLQADARRRTQEAKQKEAEQTQQDDAEKITPNQNQLLIPMWKWKNLNGNNEIKIFGNKAFDDGQTIQPQDHFAFSPLPNQPFSVEGLALLALIAPLAKDPARLERVAIKYLDSCARIVESIQDACHSNWLTALDNQYMSAGIAHRMGLLDDGSYLRILKHYQSVFDKMLTQGYVIEGLNTLVQGTKAVAGMTSDIFGSLAKLAPALGALG